MLNEETLPAAEHVLEEVEAYPWHINTKYYTADVRICTTDTRTIGDEEFANSVQALILIFDSKQVRFLYKASAVHKAIISTHHSRVAFVRFCKLYILPLSRELSNLYHLY